MGKSLVTGASGFIGRHLVSALLARGEEVTCLVRQNSRVELLRPLGVRLVEGDVTSPDRLPEAVVGADVVYHLAGLTRARSRADFLSVNEAGVANVLDACRQRTTPPVVVVVSSLAAAGPSQRDRPRTEAEPPSPVSNYGRSKLAGELAAEARAGDLPITIVRPPIVLGEGDTMSLALFQMIAKSGIHIVAGFRQVFLSMLHVGDLAEALILAAQRGQRLLPSGGHVLTANEPGKTLSAAVDPRGRYFIASERDPSYRELGLLIGQALGRRWTQIVHVPRRCLWIVGAFSEVGARLCGRAPSLGFDKAREALAGHWTCSPAQAAAELSFAPSADFLSRLRQTVEWYRQERWL